MRPELNEAGTTPNEPLVHGLVYVADTPTDVASISRLVCVADTPTDASAFCAVRSGKAHTTADEPVICRRIDVASKPAHGDRLHGKRERLGLHYEPPRTGENR